MISIKRIILVVEKITVYIIYCIGKYWLPTNEVYIS